MHWITIIIQLRDHKITIIIQYCYLSIFYANMKVALRPSRYKMLCASGVFVKNGVIYY